jgi:hypothetical protein
MARTALRQKLRPALAAGRSRGLGLLPFAGAFSHDALGVGRSWTGDREPKGDRRRRQETNELRMSFPIRTLERARASAYREEDRSAKPDSPVMSDRYIRSGSQRNAPCGN